MVPKDDRRLANVLMVGLWMIGIALFLIIGSILYLPFFMAGVPLFLLGLIVTGFAIVRGLRIEKGASKSAQMLRLDDCLVTARFGHYSCQ